jgi:hypothetical protein
MHDASNSAHARCHFTFAKGGRPQAPVLIMQSLLRFSGTLPPFVDKPFLLHIAEKKEKEK